MPAKRRAKNCQISLYDRLMSNFKLGADPMSINNKAAYDSRMDFDLGVEHWSNRRCSDRNNLMAADFAMRDHLDDTDYLVSRWCQEFPRLAAEHPLRCKMETEKPWGDVHDPIYIEPYLDENQLSLDSEPNYKKGIWYYTGYPLCDHHDFAGVPSVFKDMQTLLGLQYRPTFFINIYNRLRALDFSDGSSHQESQALPQFARDQDEVSAIHKMALLSEYPPRDNEGDADNEDDSTFSFTDLDDLNKEINSFLQGLQKQTNVVIGKVNSKVSLEIESFDNKIGKIINDE